MSAYPGARPPVRTRTVDAYGLAISVKEWGDEAAPPLMLAHGGFDFARTFDVFAPLLADAGWRVVAWDQRGHGDSAHAALYSWEADLRDLVCVLDATTSEPCAWVGHSKGGALFLRLAAAWPHRVSKFVNIDGLPSGSLQPDVAEHERTRLLADELRGWLDHRVTAATRQRRPAANVEELAARRRRMNPRLPLDWLCHLVEVGGRHDPDGWRWKLDPTLRFGGFGPWRPSWSLELLPAIGVPMLGILAGIADEPMGWGTVPSDLEPWAPPRFRLHVAEETGHFVHVEAPAETAELVTRFLADA